MRNFFSFTLIVFFSFLMSSNISAQKRFYTLYEGDWTDPNCWTLNSSGSIADNPNNEYPGQSSNQDEVIILTGRSINLNQTITVKSVDIRGILSIDKGLSDDVVRANPHALIIKDGVLKGTDAGTLEIRSLSYIWFENADGTQYYENNAPKTDAASASYIRAHNEFYSVGNIFLTGSNYQDISCISEFGSISVDGERFFALPNFTIHRDLNILSGAFFTLGSLTQSANVVVEGNVRVENGAVLMATPQFREYATKSNTSTNIDYWKETIGTFTVKGNFINQGNVVFAQVAPKTDIGFDADHNINLSDFYVYGNSYGQELSKQNCKMKLIFAGEKNSRFYITGHTDIYQLVCNKSDGYYVNVEVSGSRSSEDDDYSLITGFSAKGSVANYSSVEIGARTYQKASNGASLLRLWANVTTVASDAAAEDLPLYLQSGTIQLASGVMLNKIGPKLTIPARAELSLQGGELEMQAPNSTSPIPYIDLKGTLSISSGTVSLPKGSKGIIASNDNLSARFVLSGGTVSTTRLTTLPNCKLVFKHSGGNLNFDKDSGDDTGTYHRTTFAIAEGGEVHVSGGKINFSNSPDKDAVNTFYIDLKNDDATADFSKSTMTFKTRGKHTHSLKNTILGNINVNGAYSANFADVENSKTLKISGDLSLSDNVIMYAPRELELQGNLFARGTSNLYGPFVKGGAYKSLGKYTYHVFTSSNKKDSHGTVKGYIYEGGKYHEEVYNICYGHGNRSKSYCGEQKVVEFYAYSEVDYLLLPDLICTGNKNTRIETQNPIVLNSLTLKKDVESASLTISELAQISLGRPEANNGFPGKGLQAIQGKLVGPVFFTAVDDGQEIFQGDKADLTGTYLNFAGGALGNKDKGTIYLASNVHARAAQFLNEKDRKCIVSLGQYNLKLNFIGDYIDGKNIIPRRNANTGGYTEEAEFSYNRSFWTDGTVSAGGLSLRLNKRPKSTTIVPDGGNYSNVLYPIGYDEGYAPAKVNSNFTFAGTTIVDNEFVLADCYFTIIPVKTKHPAVPSTGEAIDVYWRTQVENLSSDPIVSYNQAANNDGYRCRLLFRLPTIDNSSVVGKFKPNTERVGVSDLADEDLQCVTEAEKKKINDLDWHVASYMSVRKAYLYQNNIWHDLTRRAWWLDLNPSEATKWTDNRATRLEGYLEDTNWPILHTSNFSRNSRRTNDSWVGVAFDLPIDICSNSFNIAFGAALIDGDWTSGNKLENWKSYELYSEPQSGNVASWTNAADWYYIDNYSNKKKDHAPGIQDVVHIQEGHEVNYTSATGLKCNQLVVDGTLTLASNVKGCDVHQISGDGTIIYTVDVSNKNTNTAANWKDSWASANTNANFLVKNDPSNGYDYSLFQKNPKAHMVFLLSASNSGNVKGDKIFSLPTWLGDYPNLKIEYQGSGRQDRHSADLSGVTTEEIVINGDFEVKMVDFTVGTSANFKSLKVNKETIFSEGSVFTASDDPDFNLHLYGNVTFKEDAKFVKNRGNLHLYADITNSGSTASDVILNGNVYFEGTGDQNIVGPFTIADQTQFNVNIPSLNNVFMKGVMEQGIDNCSTLRLNIEKGTFDFRPVSYQDNIRIAGKNGSYIRIPTGAGLAINNADIYTNITPTDGSLAHSILLDGKLTIGENKLGSLSTVPKCTSSGMKVGGIGYLSNAELNMADNKATLTAAFIAPASDEGKITFYLGAVNTVNLGNGNENITRYADKGILDIRGASTVFTAGINSVINISATSANPETIPAIRNTAIRTTFINTDNNGVTFNINVPGKTVGVYSMPLQKVNIKGNTTVKAMNMASWALQINGDLTTESGSTLDMNNYNLTLKGKWNHNGTYVPGTNTTTFSGVDFTSSVNTKFNNLTCDGQVSLTSDKILWVNGKFLLNTGDVTMKLKSGSSINGFVDVVDANVRPKGAQGKTDLPETSSNLLVCTGDVEIKYGTSIKNADEPYDANSPAGIFAYSQDEYTSLFCEGSMPVLRLSSDHFIQASKPQAYAMCITKQLQLAGAVLNIGSNRLRIMNGADIVNAEGDKTSSDFSMENMIASNLSNTDHGVEVEFVSGSSSVSLTLPIGSTGKYTPAILNELNMTVDMTKEAKERSLRIAPNALVFPGVNESEKNNVLQYYWTLYQGSGLTFVPGSGYMELETYFSDAKARDYVLTTENVAEKYGIAVLMKNSMKWIRKSNADIPGVVSLKGVTPEVIVLHYPQITGMTNLSGSYLAASNDAQLYVNEYISSGSGFAWSDGHYDSSVATWTRKYLDAEGKTVTVDPQRYSKSDLQGGRVTITGDSRIIVDGNGWQTTSMTIEGVGTINRENNGFLDLGETINHNFNVLAGRGWLGISRPELPAADYSSFIEPGGGTLVYMGGDKDNHKDYKILTSDASVNNVIITGSGKRTWNELSTLAVHGDFSLGTDIAVLTSEDLTLHIPDASTVRFGGNVYIGDGVMTGRGGYVFNGSAAQTLSHIQSSSNPFQAFTLTLQNANGLTTTMPINIGSEKDNIGSTLKFVAGKLTVGAGGSLTVYDNQSSSITGYSNTKYVVGQLSRNVGTGSFQVFPIGNETRYAPISLQGATTGMWTAEYSTSAIAKEESDVNNVYVLPSNSFWKINNENSKLARVKLHYSNEVIEGATPNKSTYTIVTTDISSAPGKWSEMPSNADVSWNLESVDAFSGKQQNGTEPRYVTFGRVKSDKKAPGWRGTESTDWFDKNNWSFKEVPGDNDDVVIPSNMTNYPLVGSATSANVGSITLEPGAKLTVSEATLQVNGNITVGSDYGLRVVHSPSKMSSVIADNIYKADGVTEYNTAWVYRYLVSGRLYYLGSAVYEGNGSNPASFAGGFAHLYNPSMEGAGQYNLYEDYSTKVASIGKNAIDEFTGSVKFSKWDKWEQVGKLYMKNQYQATAYTEGRGWNGWYLMTNPYPAPIRISDIDFGEGIEKSVHVRTFSVPSGQGEYIWATSSEDVSINGGNGVIAPHQAFFVKVKEGGDITSLKIRKPSNATTSSLKSASIEEQTKATIMANFKLVSENTQEENEYEMVWKFGNGSLDLTVDDTHLYLDGKQQLGVYKQGEILSIPSYPDINQMREYTFPLYVKVNDETNRASIKMPYSVFHYEYVEIVLVDKELGVEQDLRTNFKYTFDCEPGKEYKDRFEIRIYNSIGNPEVEEPENPEQEGVQTGIEDIENDECGSIAIFQNEDQVLITISDDIFTGEATIRVIDVKGVIVAQKKIVENRGTIQLPSAKGIYIVEVVSGNAVEHRKVRK